MQRVIYFLLFSILLFSCHRNETIPHFQNPEDSLVLLVPLYSFPTDNNGQYWTQVREAADLVPVSVIWGLIDTADQQVYKQWTGKLKQARHIQLLAYIATAGATQPIDTIKWQVDYYVHNFPVDGIFFDEVSNDWSDFQYYQEIIAYAHSYSQLKTVILNSPYADPSFVGSTSADAVVIFENYGRYWDDFDFAGYKYLPSSTKAAIAHSVMFRSKMQAILQDAVLNNIGYVFVTDKDYSKLPSYWDDEVDFVHKINTNNY